MRGRKSLLALAGAALLLAAVFIGLEIRAARAARERTAALLRRRHGLAREKAELTARLAELNRRRDELNQSLASARLAEEARLEALRIKQEKLVRVLGAWQNLSHRLLYRKLGFTPAQVEAFEKIALAHWLRVQDIDETAKANNLTRADSALQTLLGQENAQYLNEIAAAFGSPVAQEVQNFDRSQQLRGWASTLAGNVYAVSPLTLDQAEQLTQIMSNNSASYQAGGLAKLKDMNFEAVAAQAGAVLTPAQLTALKSLYYGYEAGKQLGTIVQSLTGGPTSAVSSK